MTYLLIGFSGSGKTSVGTELATLLGLEFIEMDIEILHNSSFKSIEEVYHFSPSLWEEVEIETSKYLARKSNLVISTPGGFVENQLNFTYFKQFSQVKVIYLKASLEVLKKRLDQKYQDFKTQKNFFTKLQKMHTLRDSLYAQFADLIIETDHKTYQQTVNDILSSKN